MKNLSQHIARLEMALDKFTNDLVASHVADAIAAIPSTAVKASRKVTKAAKKATLKEDVAPVSTYTVVLEFLKGRDPMSLKDIASGCDLDIEQARSALIALRKSRAVQTQGERRGMKYHLAG